MSELLYIYGELDPRVRPLVYTLKSWAKSKGIIREERPTRYFTNFGFSILVFNFLMQEYSMLPPVKTLMKLARPEDRIVSASDEVNCTFLRDVTAAHAQTLNAMRGNDSLRLHEMLKSFFKFYIDFRFDRKAIDILTGDTNRPSRDGRKVSNYVWDIDVVNPLEPELNICAHVGMEAVSVLKSECARSYKSTIKLLNGSEPVNLVDILGTQDENAGLKIRDLYAEDDTRQRYEMKLTSMVKDTAGGANVNLLDILSDGDGSSAQKRDVDWKEMAESVAGSQASQVNLKVSETRAETIQIEERKESYLEVKRNMAKLQKEAQRPPRNAAKARHVFKPEV